MATENPVMRIDPLRILNLAEVIRRTSYSERKIHALLAADKIAGTAGVCFAKPMKPVSGSKRPKLEWRETALVRWLNSREEEGI